MQIDDILLVLVKDNLIPSFFKKSKFSCRSRIVAKSSLNLSICAKNSLAA